MAATICNDLQRSAPYDANDKNDNFMIELFGPARLSRVSAASYGHIKFKDSNAHFDLKIKWIFLPVNGTFIRKIRTTDFLFFDVNYHEP